MSRKIMMKTMTKKMMRAMMMNRISAEEAGTGMLEAARVVMRKTKIMTMKVMMRIMTKEMMRTMIGEDALAAVVIAAADPAVVHAEVLEV